MSRTATKYQLVVYGISNGDRPEEYIIIASNPAPLTTLMKIIPSWKKYASKIELRCLDYYLPIKECSYGK